MADTDEGATVVEGQNKDILADAKLLGLHGWEKP